MLGKKCEYTCSTSGAKLLWGVYIIWNLYNGLCRPAFRSAGQNMWWRAVSADPMPLWGFQTAFSIPTYRSVIYSTKQVSMYRHVYDICMCMLKASLIVSYILRTKYVREIRYLRSFIKCCYETRITKQTNITKLKKTKQTGMRLTMYIPIVIINQQTSKREIYFIK